MPRTVLILAYHYPPHGGAGVQRTQALVQHLPSYGWSPIVLTGPGDPSSHWTPLDPSLEHHHGDAVVLRITKPEPMPGRLRTRAESWLGLPSPFQAWFSEGLEQRIGRLEGRVDVVLGEFGPYESAAATVRASRLLGVPWVADLQDPWALDEMWLYPTGLHRHLDVRRMRRYLANAAAVIMNTTEAARRVRVAFPALPTPIHDIPNGFAAEDFRGPLEPRADGRFRIVHSGSLHTEMGLHHRRRRTRRRLLRGMPVPCVDFLSRSLVYLLDALERVRRESPEMAGVLELHLAGPLTPTDEAVLAGRDYVRAHGFIPHVETLRLVRTADLLFLPMHSMPVGEKSGLVPAKTYEYAASGRRVLAAVPEGDARDLLSRLGTATLVGPTDVGGMAVAIRDVYDAWRRFESPPSVDENVLRTHEYGYLAGRVALVLEAASKLGRPASEGLGRVPAAQSGSVDPERVEDRSPTHAQ